MPWVVLKIGCCEWFGERKRKQDGKVGAEDVLIRQRTAWASRADAPPRRLPQAAEASKAAARWDLPSDWLRRRSAEKGKCESQT